MYESKKIVEVTFKKMMAVGDTQFQVPFGTMHYNGYLYYNVPGVKDGDDAVRRFEEFCRKENILLGRNMKYEYRSEKEVPYLYVSGDFLFFADNKEEIAEKCEKNLICPDGIKEASSGFVTIRSEKEIG